MPAVELRCSGCRNRLTTYLNVLADIFGKYSKVLIDGGEAKAHEPLTPVDPELEEQPAYFCVNCWQST